MRETLQRATGSAPVLDTGERFRSPQDVSWLAAAPDGSGWRSRCSAARPVPPNDHRPVTGFRAPLQLPLAGWSPLAGDTPGDEAFDCVRHLEGDRLAEGIRPVARSLGTDASARARDVRFRRTGSHLRPRHPRPSVRPGLRDRSHSIPEYLSDGETILTPSLRST